MKKSLLYHFWAQSGFNYAGLASTIYDNHATRVAADGGTIESEAVAKSVIEFLLSTYGLQSESSFKTRFPVTIDPAVFGYKLGTGALSNLGFAANKLYSINEDGDCLQGTAASQPTLLVQNDVDGNYAYFPRSTSTINQSLSASAIGFTPATDTLVVTAKILMTNQTANTYSTIAFSGTQWLLQFRNLTANKLFRWAGTTAVADSTQYTPSSTVPHWIRVTATPASVTYEWSANGTEWTTLDSGLAIPTYGSASNLQIGYSGSKPENAGNIYYIKIENQTTATTAECDLNDYDPAVSQTQFTTNGKVWTINYGGNATGLKMSVVNRTMLQGDGIAHIISASSLAINQPHTAYALKRNFGSGGVLSGMAASSSISNNATNTTLNNGAALNISDANILKEYLIAESNGANSKLRINAGADTEGDAGANNGTYLSLFGNGAAFGNFELYSYIISAGSDSHDIKSAMNTFFNG